MIEVHPASAFRIIARHSLSLVPIFQEIIKTLLRKWFILHSSLHFDPFNGPEIISTSKNLAEEQLILIPEGISKPFTHCIFSTCYKLLGCFL